MKIIKPLLVIIIMPCLFQTEVKFEGGKYILWNVDELANTFPYLVNKVINGKFISMYRDGRIIRINKEFKFKLYRTEKGSILGEILESNPLEELGLPLPSSYFLL
jgi:hypothetical protein